MGERRLLGAKYQGAAVAGGWGSDLSSSSSRSSFRFKLMNDGSDFAFISP